ncbi:unnamed protein product [Musa hybrid cultivar]
MQNEQGIAISSMAAEQWSTEKITRFPRRDSAIGNRDGMMFESNINFNFAPGFALFSFSGTPLRDDDWDFVEADPLSLISIHPSRVTYVTRISRHVGASFFDDDFGMHIVCST